MATKRVLLAALVGLMCESCVAFAPSLLAHQRREGRGSMGPGGRPGSPQRLSPDGRGRGRAVMMGGQRGGAALRMAAGEAVSSVFCDRVLVEGELVGAQISVAGAFISGVEVMSRSEWEAAGSPGEDMGEGNMVVPAFVNSHTHLSLACLRGAASKTDFEGNVVEDMFFRFEGNLEPGDVKAFVRMGCWEALMQGVGCCFDHYYFAESLVEAFQETGMSGVIAPTLQDLEGPGTTLPGCGHEEAFEATLAIHRRGGLREEYGIAAAFGPHATDTVSPELWKRIAEAAEREGLPIHAHVGQSLEELERCQERHGCTPVGLLKRSGVLGADASMLLVHAMYVTGEDLSELSPDRHFLGLCPSSAIQFGFPCDYPSWHAAGLRVCLGSDAACSNDSMNVQQEMRSLAGGAVFGVHSSPEARRFVETGSVEDARSVQATRNEILKRSSPLNDPAVLLDTVWKNPGEFAGNLPVGKVEKGHLANLLVVNCDHACLWPNLDPMRGLAFADVANAIEGMCVSGKWVGDRGDFRRSIIGSVLYKEHLAEANDRINLLMKRAGYATG